MKNIKKMFFLTLTIMLALSFVACNEKKVTLASKSSQDKIVSDSQTDTNLPVKLRIGTFAGGTEIACKLVTDILESRFDYEIETLLFEGNTLPATALKDGDLDMVLGNSLTWMHTFCEQNGCDFTMLEPYYYYTAFGLYSAKHATINDIPQNAQIIIASDSTNMNKSLRLLQEAGLITLSEPSDGGFVTTLDIIDNPRNIKIVEGDVFSTARSIEDVDAVVATSTVAVNSGKIDPNSYLIRDNNPTPIGFFTRTENANKEWAKNTAAIIESGEINDMFNKLLEGRYFLVTEWDN